MAYTKLPADLPENWQIGQVVSPNGVDVGLTTQHGYNYLMNAVNAAQKQVNILSAAAEDLENSYSTLSEKTTMITGTTDPTENTVGLVGQMYYNTTNTALYVCTTSDAGTGTYAWELVGENIQFGNDTPTYMTPGNLKEFYYNESTGVLYVCTDTNTDTNTYTWTEVNTPIGYAPYDPSKYTDGSMMQLWVNIQSKSLFFCQGESGTDDDGKTTYSWIQIEGGNQQAVDAKTFPIGSVVYMRDGVSPADHYNGVWWNFNTTSVTAESSIVYVGTADEFRNAMKFTAKNTIIVITADIDFNGGDVISGTVAAWNASTYKTYGTGIVLYGCGHKLSNISCVRSAYNPTEPKVLVGEYSMICDLEIHIKSWSCPVNTGQVNDIVIICTSNAYINVTTKADTTLVCPTESGSLGNTYWGLFGGGSISINHTNYIDVVYTSATSVRAAKAVGMYVTTHKQNCYFCKNYGDFSVTAASTKDCSLEAEVTLFGSDETTGRSLAYGCYNEGNFTAVVNPYSSATTVGTFAEASAFGTNNCMSTNRGNMSATNTKIPAYVDTAFATFSSSGNTCVFCADCPTIKSACFIQSNWYTGSNQASIIKEENINNCVTNSNTFFRLHANANPNTRLTQTASTIDTVKTNVTDFSNISYTPLMIDGPFKLPTDGSELKIWDRMEPSGIDISDNPGEFLTATIANDTTGSTALLDSNGMFYAFTQKSTASSTGTEEYTITNLTLNSDTTGVTKVNTIDFTVPHSVVDSISQVAIKAWLRLA